MSKYNRSMLRAVIIILLPVIAVSGEIEVRKQILNENGEIEPTTLEHVVTIFDGKKHEFTGTHVKLIFNKLQGEFEKHVSIAIKKASDKYRFCSFDAEIPFYQQQGNIDFVLFGHHITPGSHSDIRELRSIDPNTIGIEELFRYYAKSRIQASYVLKNVLATDAVSRDNIKAVYSFLQATDNLAIKRYIQADGTAHQSATWLFEACAHSADVCDNAVGTANIKQVLSQFKELDAHYYEKLYDEILQLRTIDFDAFCDLMVSLQDSFEKMQDEQILKVNRRKLTAQVALAVAGCYAKSAWGVAYKKGLVGKEKNAILKKQMLVLEHQLTSSVVNASSWPGLAAQLKGHKQDLQNLLDP